MWTQCRVNGIYQPATKVLIYILHELCLGVKSLIQIINRISKIFEIVAKPYPILKHTYNWRKATFSQLLLSFDSIPLFNL